MKKKGIVKGASSGMVVSLLVHVAAFMLAGLLVVFTVYQQEEKKFVPPKPVDRPKMKLKKPKVKVKKNAKPKSTTRIVTNVQKANMPDIQLPEMSGMGEGFGGGEVGGFDLTPDLSLPGLLGNDMSIGNDFVGTFYDFKRARRGTKLVTDQQHYQGEIRRFMKAGWKTSKLAKYYRSPKKLYSTTFVIPTLNSEVAPIAFGEDETEGNYWMAHYKGQLVHQKGITFRFLGSGDELIAVRVNGEVVMAAAWPTVESEFIGDIWRSSSADSRKWWIGNNTAVVGDWITLEPGVPLDMEIILGDNGGLACLMLAVQEKDVEYERRAAGFKFPIFKTEKLSHDLMDAIYRDMVVDELSLTTGPIFCDYDSSDAEANTLTVSEESAPEPHVVEKDPKESKERVWTLNDGKSFEAEYIASIGDKVVVKPPGGNESKILLSRFSASDRAYMEVLRPPTLKVSVSKKEQAVYSIIDGVSSGNVIAYDYTYTGFVKQTSATTYNHELTVEFFAIGKERYGDKYILLDRQESRFVPSRENQFTHRFTGNTVRHPYFTLYEIERGVEDSDSLIVVTDKRGEIIAHKASAKWLYENFEALRKIPVGRYMDKTCTRVYPTSPPRTLY
jgi:hypothetical protein